MASPTSADELARAAELLQQGRFSKALDACRAVLAAHPGDLDAEHLLARVLCESGRPAFAVMTLQHVVAQRPNDPAFGFSLGRAQRMAGELDAAEESLRRVLELDPDRVYARFELAET